MNHVANDNNTPNWKIADLLGVGGGGVWLSYTLYNLASKASLVIQAKDFIL